jgi:hypothetical protein
MSSPCQVCCQSKPSGLVLELERSCGGFIRGLD